MLQAPNFNGYVSYFRCQVSGLRRALAATAAQAGVSQQMTEDKKHKSNMVFHHSAVTICLLSPEY